MHEKTKLQPVMMVVMIMWFHVWLLIGCCTLGNVTIKSKCLQFLDLHSKPL